MTTRHLLSWRGLQAGDSPLSALAPAPPAAGLTVPFRTEREGLIAAFLAGRSERTLLAYRRDLEDFRAFVGAADAGEASDRLVRAAHGEANALALAYRAHMMERGLHAATVNRRLAALRSMVKLANRLGVVPWRLEVEGARSAPYRDTRGPGREAYRALLAAAQARPGAKGLRDVAIVRLLHDVALRRGELVRLDMEDVDLAAARLLVLGKARTQKEPITLPAPTAALAGWVAARGAAPGPLFGNFDRAGKGPGRLTGAAVYAIVRSLGAAAGVNVRPHGLRHLAITTALDGTGGDVRKVQRFSRHRDLRVLTVYDDNRRDMAGEVAAIVAEMP
jgi:integrase/recombinase XerC